MAEQLKLKIEVMEMQLYKMEDQTSTIVLRNCVSQWQLCFSQHVSQCLRKGQVALQKVSLLI
jgi:hypothetical protein